MALTVGDILEIKLLGTIENQRIMTVLHYRIETGTGGGDVFADLKRLCDQFANQTLGATPLDKLLDLQGSDYTLDSVTVQRVAPARTIYASTGLGSLGQGADPAISANVAAVLTKRGVTGGRRGIGSVHIGGIMGLSITAGRLNFGALTTAALILPQLTAVLSSTIPLLTLFPCIYNPGATPNYQLIAEITIQETVRTMHRRTVGLGI